VARLLSSIALLFLLAACSEAPEQSELIGVYSMQDTKNREVLTLREDGIYENAYYEEGSLAWIDKDTWEYERYRGRSTVAFSGFRFGIRDATSPFGGEEWAEARQLWAVKPTRKADGTLAFCFGKESDGRCFVRAEATR